ncbi:MAG: hypothetical protein Q8O22_04175 [Candidatus Omnitrophota bacterium]|nr:hypothetical protein [Candidatus Omnitrophota bacterium]
MILFFVLNFLAAATAFLCSRKVFDFGTYKDGQDCEIDYLSAAFILYLVQIVVSELLLGIFGWLNLANLVFINLAAFLFVLCFCRAGKTSPGLGVIKRGIAAALNNKAARMSLCVILCFGLVKLLVNLFNPPFGWDSLNYHFTFAVEWLKHANLVNPITINDDFAPTYYPINGSLYFFWLLAPVRSIFLADLGQAPFFILAFFALFGIARKTGVSKELSFWAAALFTLIPNYFKQLQIAYVDVMVAALFFACLNFLFLLEKKFSRSNLLFFSLSLGLLLGTKLIALPYCVLLIAPFLYLWMRDSIICCPYKTGISKTHVLIVVFAAVLALGGFSYLRNFAETCNPFYPLNIKLWGRTILNGVIVKSSYAAHFKIADYSLAKLLFHEGLGGQALIFVLPAAIAAIPVVLWKKRRLPGFMITYFLLLPVLLWLVFRYFIPLANTRYLYPLLGVGMVGAIYTASVLNIPRIALRIAAVLCVLASMSELAKRQELVVSILLTLAMFFLLPVIARFLGKMRKPKAPALIVLSILAAFFFLKAAEGYYIKNEFQRYDIMRKYSGFWKDAAVAWDWLNSNTSGNNIAYVGRPVPFPLYGTHFKNNVYYVSLNLTEPAKIHYYPAGFYRWDDDFSHMQKDFESTGNYRSGAEYSIWLENLRKKSSDYLFVYSLHQTKNIEFPVEDAWARAHADVFEPVFNTETVKIYKISK